MSSFDESLKKGERIMKILIIEDEFHFSEKLRQTLQDMGEVVTCIDDYGTEMPSIEKVIGLIEEADLILLDADLGPCHYYGEDLLPYCTKKKVIGISSAFELGPINFTYKQELLHEKNGYYKKRLRSLVRSTIKKSTGG